MSLGVGSFAAAGGGPLLLPTRTFGALNDITSNNLVINAPSIAIGEAGAGRRVVVALTYYSPLNVPVVTIGGVTATFCGSKVRSSSTTTMAFFIATVPTGSTATVSFSFSGNTYSVSYAWWVVRDLLSNSPASFGGAANANTLSTILNCPAGGVILAFYIVGYGVSPGSLAWSGVNQDGSRDYGTQQRMSAAGKIQATDVAGYSVSCAFNYNSNLMLAMAFR